MKSKMCEYIRIAIVNTKQSFVQHWSRSQLKMANRNAIALLYANDTRARRKKASAYD